MRSVGIDGKEPYYGNWEMHIGVSEMDIWVFNSRQRGYFPKVIILKYRPMTP
jgi:hypothetical protein